MIALSLRTKNCRQQNLLRLALALMLLVFYGVAVKVLDLGSVGCFWGVAQMRAFLPALILFGILAYETRWDGITRKEGEKSRAQGQTKGANRPHQPPTSDPNLKPSPQPEPRPVPPFQPEPRPVPQPTPSPLSFAPPAPQPNLRPQTTNLTPEEAWKVARAMPHNVVPNPVLERDYYALVVQAANGGHVDALLKLSDYARQRGANVEAYYWAAVAQKRGVKGLDGRLGEIRKQWLFNEANGEYENVYEFFPETCGTIARSLLRIACSIDAPYARKRLRELAALGDVNAKLFC